MALNAGDLESALKTRIKAELDAKLGEAPAEGNDHRQDFSDALALAISDEVVTHILDNLEITGVEVDIELGSVIIAVAGGSGAPATGTPNPAKITLKQTSTQTSNGTGLIE